jgi:hypothetical protein
MRETFLAAMALIGLLATYASAEVPVSLRGSPGSMIRQNEVARSLDFAFVQTAAQLRELERDGVLLRLDGNADYEIADFVSFPHARAELKLFIERLSAQYRAATGEKLVVTSLTRPASNQPRNSHQLSVHPTGMAVDLRVSQRAASREWLEETLLSLESQGLLDITRERNPPHYHVALFPEAYLAHVERLLEQERLATPPPPPSAPDPLLAASAFLPAEREQEPAGGTPGLAAALLLVIPGGWLGRTLWRRRRNER